MRAPRIAARIAGKFILRVIGLFVIVLGIIAVSIAVEYFISTNPNVPDAVAHVLQFGLLLAAVVVVIVASLLFGRMLSGPLATVIAWTGNLARGRFEPPRDSQGRIMGTDDHGQWRAGYRTFHEVFEALDTLTDRLQESERQREELRRMREEWIAGVSHDLKTPLASVRGYAQLLATDEEPPEEVHRQAEAILHSAQHMERLIDDLRLSTQLRANALPLKRERVDAVVIGHTALLTAEENPRFGGYTFEFAPADGPLPIDADANLLGRAVLNIVTNAVSHNPAGTTVRLAVERADRSVRFVVGDDGVGMDEEMLAHLFDRYYRGTSTTVDSAGTGLGMAIAAQLVEAHEGTIDVASEPGVGTTVTITVPLADAADVS